MNGSIYYNLVIEVVQW